MLKGFTRNFRPLKLLTDEQVEAIQRGILGVLEDTGVRMEHKHALQILDKGGCQVDYGDMRARFPPGLVTECLNKCPSSFRVKARDPNNDVVIGGNTLYFASDPGMQGVDLDTGEPRDVTKKEFYDAVKVYDALEHLHVLHGNSPHTSFEGIHPRMATVETFAARTINSSKVNRCAVSFGNDMFCIEMARAVGATSLVGIPGSPPLSWAEDAIDGELRAIEAGFPLLITSGDIYGATAPVTIAGSVVTDCATIIAALVLAQLAKPGTPATALSFTSPQNMRTGAPLFGNIGVALHDAAFNQIWREFGVPPSNLEPGISNSKRIDFQTGYEKSILTLASAVSGAAMICLHGTIYGELTSHPLQAILDDDIAAMIGRFLEGVEVNDETLAIDLIGEVGPVPGHYLGKAHTRKWWRREQSAPKAADLLTIPEWLNTGKKSCIDYAKERMEEMLATHKPALLTTSQEAEIERVLKEARKYHGLDG